MEDMGGRPEQLRETPKAMLFDLDDTLAKSFQPPSDTMIERLSLLLDKMPVAIVTAAGLPRIESGFLHRLRPSRKFPLYIFANGSAECYVFKDNNAERIYRNPLNQAQRQEIDQAIIESLVEAGLPPYGEGPAKILDRDALVAYAALGLEAKEEDKQAWDPDMSKRKRLKEVLDKRLPHYEVLIGGKTTIDITTKGMTKAYGVNWLAKELHVNTADMLYVGDAFQEYGNDAPVIPTGVRTLAVDPRNGPAETEKIIEQVLAAADR